MSIDSIGNFCTVIRNGLRVGKRFVTVPSSQLKVNIATVLKDEGYIKDFKIEEEDKVKKNLTIYIKYVNGESVIHKITRISKPSRRYERFNQLTPVIGGLGISILTTSSGVITDQKAKTLGIGGEIICHVW